MKRFLLIAAIAVLATTGSAAAASFKGVVVARTSGGALVAGTSGAVCVVRTSARVGARIVARAGRVTIVGRAHRALVRGVVVRRSGGTMVLSAAHRLLVVRGARRAAAVGVPPTAPQPGDVVSTQVTIGAQGDLDEEDTQGVGQVGDVQVQATVTAVGPGTVTVGVNGQALTLQLPNGLTLPTSVVGTQVTLTLHFANGQVTANDDDQGDGGGGDGDHHGGGGDGGGDD